MLNTDKPSVTSAVQAASYSELADSASSSAKVLRNTYALLSMTLLFSAFMAAVSAMLELPAPGIIITLAGYFGLLFLTTKYRNRGLGLVFVFALTGFMGYTIGPVVNAYLNMSAGPQIVISAMSATGLIFASLSAYVLITRKDFSFMGSFLMVGILVGFLLALGAMFLEISGLSLAVSAMFVLLMSGLILYQTSEIIHGGETNYIMATTTLFVAIFNLFISLLQLLGIMDAGD